ncbi:MAG: sigma-70 family RNA polymerase sigma factor [Thermodesulfovibrionales bacterium]|nr:sigma-70 family RNA polymerase sigma factor [Thermodesulfovibrionales bacterium]
MGLFNFFQSHEVVFEERFLIYTNDIYRTALRLTGSADDADDLTQETFLKAYEAFSQGTKVVAPKPWLFKIMRNTFINQRRSLQSRTETVSLEDIHEAQYHETPEYLFILKGLEGKLHHALQTMPIEYRLALLLCDSEGMSYAEIAEVMQCPVGTVRSRINRAREIVKDAVIESNREKKSKKAEY